MAEEFRVFEGDTQRPVPVGQIGLEAKPIIQEISATAFTLNAGNHGKILDFTAGTAVTVTVPPGLPSDFCCGISQGGAGAVTLSPGDGVTINEPDEQLATAAQYVMLTLMAFSENVFRLYGRTA